ncbi:hypothetical protein KY290_005126 [Solanum tuberosum]|uniref:Uncharacterized protein n=1 Tax=Solanum tuberosum TaxID=4113 RepID=A0ABQ7WD82_SOLTU|nr:hypothetical protein KY284_024903 [Solanum tuberosum]KAH0751964.1 hypothetical protein KY285_005112 [Solanum tuberosum]KAH0778699.1 hypothetical protein KY290_005126 [Solanum tuberosum]
MAKDPRYVKFFEFSLALQIWFYECCIKVDKSIFIRTCHVTPHIFNWDISKNKIYFEHLKKGMLRKYGNHYIFQDVVLMDDEHAVIEMENMDDSSFNKFRKPGNIRQSYSHTRKNEKELPYNPSHVGVIQRRC